jgi:hypothetical protein
MNKNPIIRPMQSPHYPGCCGVVETNPDTGTNLYVRKPDGTYWKARGDISSLGGTSLELSDAVTDEKVIARLDDAYDELARKTYGI